MRGKIESSRKGLPGPFCGAKVDVGERSGEFQIAARLHLNKAERFTIDCDDVDLADHLNLAGIAADRGFEIRHNDPVTVLLKELGRQTLAAVARLSFTCYRRADILF